LVFSRGEVTTWMLKAGRVKKEKSRNLAIPAFSFS